MGTIVTDVQEVKVAEEEPKTATYNLDYAFRMALDGVDFNEIEHEGFPNTRHWIIMMYQAALADIKAAKDERTS